MKNLIAGTVAVILASFIAGPRAQVQTAPTVKEPMVLSTLVTPRLLTQAPFVVEFSVPGANPVSFPATSWSTGTTQSPLPQAGAARASYVDINRSLDGTSSQLRPLMNRPQPGSLTITAYKAGKAVEQLVYTGATLTSMTLSGQDPPQEHLRFTYTAVRMVKL